MVRQDITINNYTYLVDIFKAETSDLIENRFAEFVMLRNYEYRNEIIYDTNIYIIEKDLLEEYIANYKSENPTIAFPVVFDNFTGYSIEYSDFNNDFNDNTFINNRFDQYDLFNIVDSKPEIAKLACDKVRIYHPHNKLYLDAIVYFDNYIGNTHFHWFCRPLNKLTDNHAEKVFKVNNIVYSEYIEFWVPSPEKVINENVYYIENLNNVVVLNNKDLIKTIDNNNYVSTHLFNVPFYSSEDEIKTYNPELVSSVINTYIAYPLNITIYPYSTIDVNNKYIADTNLIQNSDMIYSELMFRVCAKAGFNDGIISIVSTFDYPYKEKFNSFRDAYKYFYNVDLADYEGIIETEDGVNELDILDQKQCGFKIEIFNNLKRTNCIYTNYFEIDHPDTELDDFAFNLNNIFTDWRQIPEFLICRTTFTDKYLGNKLVSNDVLLTKDWIKYCINETDNYRLSIENNQEKLDKISDMDLSKFNFIDKVNCVIKREVKEDSKLAYNTKNQPRVLYKPIFFRTSDLQNINIKSGFIQNIGLNLAEYMTKVASFKLVIGDLSLVEFARNDVYVIFKLDGKNLTLPTGEYHILTQDDEYVSSGRYTVV